MPHPAPCRRNQVASGLPALPGHRAHAENGVVDSSSTTAPGTLQHAIHPIRGAPSDYDELLESVGDRRFVLLGEASHGTRDFYRERARITRRLVDDYGFTAVAAEADWPDAYRVNRYVMGMSLDGDADAALADFRRFPAWMWRNRDVLEFVQWLRARNDAQRHPATKARFYGLDLYSLAASMEAVVRYLDAIDPAEARARPGAVRVLRPRRWDRRGLRLRARAHRSGAL